jgi:hypothetical protein
VGIDLATFNSDRPTYELAFKKAVASTMIATVVQPSDVTDFIVKYENQNVKHSRLDTAGATLGEAFSARLFGAASSSSERRALQATGNGRTALVVRYTVSVADARVGAEVLFGQLQRAVSSYEFDSILHGFALDDGAVGLAYVSSEPVKEQTTGDDDDDGSANNGGGSDPVLRQGAIIGIAVGGGGGLILIGAGVAYLMMQQNNKVGVSPEGGAGGGGGSSDSSSYGFLKFW